jgi:hypothetical protein
MDFTNLSNSGDERKRTWERRPLLPLLAIPLALMLPGWPPGSPVVAGRVS